MSQSIKLAGFKSFVDPTTVPFPSNLSAIVGPNGCGKSNVIDAVRWVMGESSAKNLRGDSWVDTDDLNTGLNPWGIRHGVLSKLNAGDPAEVADSLGLVRNSPEMGGYWWDLDRSLILAREVYTYRGLEDRAVWADRATLNIPWHFYALHLQMAEAAQNSGREATLVEELIDRGEGFGITARGGYRGIPGTTGP